MEHNFFEKVEPIAIPTLEEQRTNSLNADIYEEIQKLEFLCKKKLIGKENHSKLEFVKYRLTAIRNYLYNALDKDN